MHFILQWLDLIWLPIGYLFIHRPHRALAAAFFLSCMLMMRLQAELMISIGYSAGLIGLWGMHVFLRGLIVYSIFYALYLLLAHYSRDTRKAVFLAASISVFFMALFVSSIVMVL